jgi:hypothetical protein
MARQRKKHATTSFDAITIEGALITPAMIQKIATRDAGDQTEADYRVPKGLTIRDEIARYFRIGQALFAGVPQASTGATIALLKSYCVKFLASLIFPDRARALSMIATMP